MVLHFKKLGHGCPLIILHGLYGSGDNWITIARALSAHFTVYLIDQRNHGLSPHSPEHSYKALTDDIKKFVEDHRLEKLCILGHSMGGKVAMNFTLQNPLRVHKLVVIDIAMRSYTSELSTSPQLAFHNKIISALSALDITFAETREEIDKQLARYVPQKNIRHFLLKNIRRTRNGEFFWSLNLEALKSNFFQLLDKIDAGEHTFRGPVLVIGGINSGYIRKEDHIDFLKAFPNAVINEFDAGHWLHSEQPELLIKRLLEFLPITSES